MTKLKDGEGAEALLACPFCGGAVEIVQIGNEATPKRGFEVRCLTWGCATKKRAMVIRQPLEKARGFAIAAWNRRAPPATPVRGGGGEGSSNASRAATRDHSLAATEAEPSARKRLSDIPAELLGNRLTSALIMQEGDLGKYDAVLTRFIEDTRKEAAEDRAEMLEVLKPFSRLADIEASLKTAPGESVLVACRLLYAAREVRTKALGREAASPLGGPILALEDLKSVPIGGDGEGSSCAMSGGTASPKSEGRQALDRSDLPPLGHYCPACEAIPQAGYCRLPGCPTAPKSESGAEPSAAGEP